MKVVTEEELAARLDFRRPLHLPPDEPESVWCIPFEFTHGSKGVRISIAKAKEIASELRASVAEAELRQLRKHFAVEQTRANEFSAQLSKAQDEASMLRSELATMKKVLRKRARSKKKGMKR